MASQTTGGLMTELAHMDDREATIHAALLHRLEQLDVLEQRNRTVTVADLQALTAALDALQSKVATAQAGATATPDKAPLTFAQLEAQVREHDASAKQLRELLEERLRSLAPLDGGGAHDAGHPDTAGHPDAAGQRPAGRPRPFRLERPLMHGADVLAFQRVLNDRFAAWGIGKRIAENGTYGPETREAAAQVALCLGLLSTDYEHGITPALRVLMHTPSRRTARQLTRAHERLEYRENLRKHYAAKAHTAAVTAANHGHGNGNGNGNGHGNGNGNGHGPAGVVPIAGGVAAAIRAAGGHFEHAIVREATRFGVPVALVCAVTEKESHFQNVFGHDPVNNPIKSPDGGLLFVTEALYNEYLRHRTSVKEAQGVGPMQLTHPELQDAADKLGGTFDPAINIRVGVKHLADLTRRLGLRNGVQAYNGAAGHDYADDVLKLKAAWEAKLAGAKAARPAAGHPSAQPGGRAAPHPGGHVPRTFTLTRPPMKGANVKRFQHDLNERFAAWGIARRLREDGSYGAQTRLAARQVAIALGIGQAEYEHGVTPRLRVLIRTPSRRSPRELQRAKAQREYRARLRKRYGAGAAAGAAPNAKATHVGDLVYPLAVHGTFIAGVADHMKRPFGNWQSDRAVDIGVPRGTAVLAVADGTIHKLGGSWKGASANPNGFNVTIDAGDRMWFYTHLVERVNLIVGQKVSAGMVLGKSGAANNVEHLHIGVSSGDPALLLKV